MALLKRRIGRGGLTEFEAKELWHSVFLSLAEIQELLEHVRTTVRRRYLYVLFCFAAFTGARRSEMLRSRVDDFDFEAVSVTIREKKKDKDKGMTFRTVPLTPAFRLDPAAVIGISFIKDGIGSR
jgi:integrase